MHLNLLCKYATYVSYLPDDCFLLNQNMLFFTIQYTKRVVVCGFYLPVNSVHLKLLKTRKAME
jgi:hypothetical protein